MCRCSRNAFGSIGAGHGKRCVSRRVLICSSLLIGWISSCSSTLIKLSRTLSLTLSSTKNIAHTYQGQREFTPQAKMNGQRAMRRKTKGIGTMAWLEYLAQEMEVGDDLECAAYLFWAMHLV
jgi:hypothetical protein